MLEMGWSEILIIVIVAAVVFRPGEWLPMMRAFGKGVARLRKMAGEFRDQFDEALKEAELDDVRKTLAEARSLNPVNALKDVINPMRQAGNDIRSSVQSSVASKPAEIWTPPSTEPAVAAAPVVSEPPVVAEPVAAPAKARKPRAAAKSKTANVAAPAEAVAAEAAPVSKKAAPRKPSKPAPADVSASPARKPSVKKPATPAATEVAAKPAPKKTGTRAKKTSDA